VNRLRFHLSIYLKELLYNIKESLILFIVVIFASSLLSLSITLTDNSYIEKQLMDSILIEYKISNKDLLLCLKKTGKLAENSENNPLLERYKSYFENFYLGLQYLCQSNNLESYSYNLISNLSVSLLDFDKVNYDIQMIGTKTIEIYSDEITTLTTYSIQSLDIIDKYNLKIIEGNADDIFQTENAVIVGSDFLFYDEEQEWRKIQIGDILHVFYPDQKESIDLEVVATYKSPNVFDFSYGEDDSFINNTGILILEEDMLEILADHPYLFYHRKNDDVFGILSVQPPIALNAIAFICKDLKSSKLFEKELDLFKREMVIFCHNNCLNDYNIKIIYPEYKDVLNTLLGIRRIYILIFVAIAILLIFLFYSLLLYCQNKRVKEIFIYKSLGKQRNKIYQWYIWLYLLLSVPAALIGGISGILLSKIVNTNILETSVNMQTEMLRYSNGGRIVGDLNTLSIPSLSLPRVCAVIVATLIAITTLVFTFIYIITKQILSEGSGRTLRGES